MKKRGRYSRILDVGENTRLVLFKRLKRFSKYGRARRRCREIEAYESEVSIGDRNV